MTFQDFMLYFVLVVFAGGWAEWRYKQGLRDMWNASQAELAESMFKQRLLGSMAMITMLQKLKIVEMSKDGRTVTGLPNSHTLLPHELATDEQIAKIEGTLQK